MKKFLSLVAFAGTVLFVSQSCTKDPCETKVCQNAGTTAKVGTDSCACNCKFGYTGSTCGSVDLSKLVRSYSMTQTGSASGAKTFTIGVANPSTNTVTISGFWNNVFVNTVTGTVSGNTLTIARQEPDADKFFVAGSAVISFTTDSKPNLVFTYTVTKEPTGTVGTPGTAVATDAITNATAAGL